MEQKQLDELDESYFGEEFIEEDLVKASKEKAVGEDIKIESLETELKIKKRSSTKKAVKLASLGSVGLTKKAESIIPIAKTESESKPKSEPKLKTIGSTEQPRVEIIDEVKPALKETSSKENSTNYNSTNNLSEPSFGRKSPSKFNLEQISTWKTITGVVLILLILSVFTQGFNFGDNLVTGAAATGKVLPLEEAEWRALRYINENLLEPPFIATVDNSRELSTVYQLDLSIGNEKIISYVTKDGRYLFPQGLDISYYLTVEEVPKKENSLGAEKPVEVPAEVSTSDNSVANEPQTDGTARTNSGGETTISNENSPATLTLTAKKWLFSPHQIAVKQGEMVTLMIEPENLDFTFSIPELNVEKAVSGPTTVTFKAEKSGLFEFTCSSCEDWRGMKGTLVVE